MIIPPEFHQYKTTIKECSYDSDHGKSLINSQDDIVNFDKVKDDYAAGLPCGTNPTSADGLFLDQKGRYILVEFKSGKVDPYNVIKKAYDSALILAGKKDEKVSWLRENAEFVLVYNPHTFTNNPNDKARANLFNGGMKMSSTGFCYYKRAMQCLKGFVYKEVCDMTESDFSNKYF